MSANAATYIAGVCNIGEAEIRRRWIGGWGASVVTAVVWFGLAAADVAAPWYWVLALPALGGTAGFVQALSHFCFNYGLRRMFNLSDLGSTNRVEKAASIRLDRRRSWQLIGTSVAIAFVVAALGVFTA